MKNHKSVEGSAIVRLVSGNIVTQSIIRDGFFVCLHNVGKFFVVEVCNYSGWR